MLSLQEEQYCISVLENGLGEQPARQQVSDSHNARAQSHWRIVQSCRQPKFHQSVCDRCRPRSTQAFANSHEAPLLATRDLVPHRLYHGTRARRLRGSIHLCPRHRDAHTRASYHQPTPRSIRAFRMRAETRMVNPGSTTTRMSLACRV